MDRRTLLYGGGVAAGLAGIGASWWRTQKHQSALSVTADSAKIESINSFWNLSFDTPDGKTLAMSGFSGKPLLLNFWATWCPPCVEELPILDAFYQNNKSKDWQVLGLAVDQPSAVRKWLQAKPLSYAVGMAGFNGTELSKFLGNSAGSLPFSVVFNASGHLVQSKTGKVTTEDLKIWRG